MIIFFRLEHSQISLILDSPRHIDQSNLIQYAHLAGVNIRTFDINELLRKELKLRDKTACPVFEWNQTKENSKNDEYVQSGKLYVRKHILSEGYKNRWKILKTILVMYIIFSTFPL